MKTYTHVEDYLEVITGYREISGQVPANSWAWVMDPIINLARYDVGVLESMTIGVVQGRALTERQAELLVKIILKYERQLAGKGIDIEPVRNPAWRLTLRKMDYTCSLFLDNDQLTLKFPYDNKLIEQIREFAKTSQGSCYWNSGDRTWTAALTEYNLSWLFSWAQLNKFDIDQPVCDLMALVEQVEASGYAIELTYADEQLKITNSESSLIEFVDNHLGGFGLDNLLTLVDKSSVLGYTVNIDIADGMVKTMGLRFYNLCASREIKINPDVFETSGDFESVLDYADQVERWPVVVYEPDLSGRMLKKLQARYGDQVLVVTKKDTVLPADVKYIHAISPVRNLDHIPLLISSAGMIFGGDKQIMMQRAEKIVYCAQDVYNKKQTGQQVRDIAG